MTYGEKQRWLALILFSKDCHDPGFSPSGLLIIFNASNKFSPLAALFHCIPYKHNIRESYCRTGQKNEITSFTLPSRDIFIAPLCCGRLVMFFSRVISGIIFWIFKAAMKSSIPDPELMSRTQIRIRFLIQSVFFIDKLLLAKPNNAKTLI